MKKVVLGYLVVATLLMTGCSQSDDKKNETEAEQSTKVEKSSANGIIVTPENFQRAEAIRNANNYVKLGADNKWIPFRNPAPIGPNAPTIRMNLDTLYSVAVVDNSNGKFNITIPESDELYTVLVFDDEAYSLYYFQTPGKHEIVSDSPFIIMIARQGMRDYKNPKDIEKAHKMQDGLKMSGNGTKPFNPTKYDQESLKALTQKLNKEFLAGDGVLVYGQFKDDVDEHKRLLSNASGWGGMHDRINTYTSSVILSGKECREISFIDPKVRDFFSFTMYDDDGYLMDGDISINSYNMKKNSDGTYTVHFNCGKDALNNISSSGRNYNYTVRTYGASDIVKSGEWNPVKPTVVIK